MALAMGQRSPLAREVHAACPIQGINLTMHRNYRKVLK